MKTESVLFERLTALRQSLRWTVTSPSLPAFLVTLVL
jgi:hypothetical protein